MLLLIVLACSKHSTIITTGSICNSWQKHSYGNTSLLIYSTSYCLNKSNISHMVDWLGAQIWPFCHKIWLRKVALGSTSSTSPSRPQIVWSIRRRPQHSGLIRSCFQWSFLHPVGYPIRCIGVRLETASPAFIRFLQVANHMFSIAAAIVKYTSTETLCSR
jgi:hypothetical protein